MKRKLIAITAMGIFASLCGVLISPAAADAAPTTVLNPVFATSFKSGYTDFSSNLQVKQSASSILTAVNLAAATTGGCSHCGSTAIAFQVVVTTQQKVALIHADNRANAVSNRCVYCDTTADAYQFIVGNASQQLSSSQLQQLADIQSQLRALKSASLSPDDLGSAVDALAQQVVTILQAPTAAAAPIGAAATLATSTPVVQVHHQFQTR